MLSSKPRESVVQASKYDASGERKDLLIWSIEAEKIVRRSLLLFFVCLFSDLDEFQNAESQEQMCDIFSADDFRSAFNLEKFLLHKRKMNETRSIQHFLGTFVHSQMFEQFCHQLLKRKLVSDHDECNDDFWKFHGEIKQNNSKFSSILDIKVMIKCLFEQEKDVPIDELLRGVHAVNSFSSNDRDLFATTECEEAFRSDCLFKMMRSIRRHLKSKNAAKIENALFTLHILLLSGPESVFSISRDMLRNIRFLLHCRSYELSSVEDYLLGDSHILSTHPVILKSRAILHLLLDLQRLSEQRKWSLLWRFGAFPHKRYKPKKFYYFSMSMKELPASVLGLQNSVLPSYLSFLINQESLAHFSVL